MSVGDRPAAPPPAGSFPRAEPQGWTRRLARRLSVWQRLSIVFGVLLLACAGAAAWLQMHQAARHAQQVEQYLLRRLALDIAQDSTAMSGPGLDDERLAAFVDRLRVTNPGVEVYLLDAEGTVTMRYPAGGALMLTRVDLDPVMRFLAGEAGPLLGDDPLRPGERKVFSAARVPPEPGQAPGYLYAVLQGAAYQQAVDLLVGGVSVQIALSSAALVVPLVVLAALSAFVMVTRPLARLTRDVEQAERWRRDAHEARGTGARDRPRDEIAILREAFARLVDANAQQWRRLRQQDQQRRELVAGISHDLRTPLASVQGYLETLLLRDAELHGEERQRYLRTALAQSRGVTSLADALLDLARLELGAVRPVREPFPIADLCLDVLQKLALAAGSREQRLVPEIDGNLPDVVADIGMIERVLTNLLDNAIRHTPAGGTITLRVTRLADGVRVEVADRGPGLSARVAARLGDPAGHWTAGRRISGDGGSGLGLQIVQRILQLHDSALEIAARDGGGSVLGFALGARSDAASAPAPAPADATTPGADGLRTA